MRIYTTNEYEKQKNYLWKRPILGLIWIAMLSASPSYLNAQEIVQTITTPETVAEIDLEPMTEAVEPSQEPALITAPEPKVFVQAIPRDPLPLSRESMGAESWYYEAKRLEQSLKTESIPEEVQQHLDSMYSLAFHFGEKTAAIEAGRTLLQRSITRSTYEGTRALALQWLDYFGPDWDVYRILNNRALESLDYPQVLEAVAFMKRLLPTTSKARATELNFYEFSARAGLGEREWVSSALAYLDIATLDSWGAKSLRLAAADESLEQETRELCLMRADFQAKEYGQAAAHALAAARRLHDSGIKRSLVSEAGRAFVLSGMKTEGIDFFLTYFNLASQSPETISLASNESPNIETSAQISPIDLPEAVLNSLEALGSPENLWVAAYYLARLWQTDEKEREAAILFLGLTDSAPSSGDADGALWYWLDITMRRIAQQDAEALGAHRSLEFGALVEISRRWRNAASFDDIIDAFARRLLREKTWSDVYSLFILLDEKLSASMRTRLLYLSARLLEEGMAITGSNRDEALAIAKRQYESILANNDAEEYYRTMSAWRLGQEPPFLASMPALHDTIQNFKIETIGFTSSENLAKASPWFQTALPLIRNYLNYELDEMASAVALRYLGSLDSSLLASLAFEFSAEGQHNAALRLARDAIYRGAGQRFPELYGLVYPKAWNDIVAGGAAIPGIPEALAYGIIRSESVFDPKAVSYAGAVGLAQLMPATAAETARGLKMSSYSLTDPKDNVTIGMTYYSYMMSRFGNKPMRAMFAYNAGPGRMSAWNKESGELPDDILLESLHLAQPRQYAKNIIQASLAYGRIHYNIPALDMLNYLVNAHALQPKVPEEQIPTPAAIPSNTPSDLPSFAEPGLPLRGYTM